MLNCEEQQPEEYSSRHSLDEVRLTSVVESRTLRVFGEIDIANGSDFEVAISSHASRVTEVVIDLTACTYMDSTGLAVLARAAKRYPHLAACRVQDGSSIARLMEITNFDKILDIEVVPKAP